jgi:hypothetical protein
MILEGDVKELTFQGSNNVHNILIAENDVKNMSVIKRDCKQIQSSAHISLITLTKTRFQDFGNQVFS